MKNNTPKLRFKEFTDEWQEKKLGDIIEFKNGKAHEQDISETGKYIVINSKFVSTDGRVKKYSERQICPINKSDIVMVMSDIPKGKAIAKCFFVDSDDKYTLNQRICSLTTKKNIAYAKYLINVVSRNPYYLKFDDGINQTNLRRDDVTNLPILLPEYQEQAKIADFLSSVDEKINLLEEKKKGFEKYKKGVMQAIFSQKIRFRQSDGSNYSDWEEKKLGEVLKIGSGRDYKYLGTGNIPVFGTGGYMVSVNKALHSGETVFIGRKGTIDKPFYFNGDFWTVDTLFYTFDFNGISPKFTAHMFQIINWQKHNEASGVPSLSKTTIEKIKVCLPSLLEQEKIAEFLTSLDNKVDLINKELEQAKLFKKSLLQQMFV